MCHPSDRFTGRLCVLLFIVNSVTSGCVAAPKAVTGVVPVAWPTDNAAPVVVPIDESWSPLVSGQRTVRLDVRIHGREQKLVSSAQFEPADRAGGTPARLWFIFQAAADDRGKAITVVPTAADDTGTPYQSTYDAPRLEIRTPKGEPILGYHHGEPIMERGYPLNDFIHPLIGLDGEVLTARSPGDHIHHRAIFWAWVRQEIDGKPIGDWWHPTNIRADARELDHLDGPIYSSFAARHDWIHTPKDGGKELPFVAEHVVCRIFATTPQGRAVDVDIALRGLVPGVRFGGTLEKDKGYGGMTIRFGAAADALIESDGRVVKQQNLNHLRASWVDWTGRFHGKDGNPAESRSGAALFVGADHPDSPPEWITRYYGPINVSWPGMNMVALPPDEPVRLRYRIWIHRGDSHGGHVETHYQAYVADWRWASATDG